MWENVSILSSNIESCSNPFAEDYGIGTPCLDISVPKTQIFHSRTFHSRKCRQFSPKIFLVPAKYLTQKKRFVFQTWSTQNSNQDLHVPAELYVLFVNYWMKGSHFDQQVKKCARSVKWGEIIFTTWTWNNPLHNFDKWFCSWTSRSFFQVTLFSMWVIKTDI